MGFIETGFQKARSKPFLIAVFWVLGLIGSSLLSLPLAFALHETIGKTGYSTDFLSKISLTYWSEVYQAVKVSLGQTLVWITLSYPLLWIFKRIAAVGVVHALQSEADASFRQGVQRFGWRGLMLSLLFLGLELVAFVTILLVCGFAFEAIQGEVAAFWIWFVAFPSLVLASQAILSLMQALARMALVTRAQSLKTAIQTGLRFPFQYGVTARVYTVWYFLILGLMLFPMVLDAFLATASTASSWAWFLISQCFIFIRHGAWLAQEASLLAIFETYTPKPVLEPDTIRTEPPPDAGMAHEIEG